MAKKKNTQAEAVDIVVSCSDVDKEFTEGYFLKELKKTNFSVWYADKKDKLQENGLAILRCKIFVSVLSCEGVTTDRFNDELSLAYVANKSVVPVALQNIRKINPLVKGGVKLMLAKINWTFFIKPERYAETMPKLVEALRVELDQRQGRTGEVQDLETEEDTYTALNQHAPDINIEDGEQDYLEEEQAATCEHLQQSINCDFWERHFKGKKEVSWIDFKKAFLDDYGTRINRQLGGGKDTWLCLMLYKDIFELRKVVTVSIYNQFCGLNKNANPDHFFERVKDYAVGITCMRNIFNMDSSVRLVAIQNLGTFQTPAVITLLFDLIEDEDPNIRAIASLAVAKTGKKTHRIQEKLIRLLQDEDRVVRESACLSLAHIKCTRAVMPILDLWRNDAIKHVREAAELALLRMGGAEAEQAIKVTQVLTGELHALRSGVPK